MRLTVTTSFSIKLTTLKLNCGPQSSTLSMGITTERKTWVKRSSAVAKAEMALRRGMRCTYLVNEYKHDGVTFELGQIGEKVQR